jgi:hypothetical protein
MRQRHAQGDLLPATSFVHDRAGEVGQEFDCRLISLNRPRSYKIMQAVVVASLADDAKSWAPGLTAGDSGHR